MAITDFFDDEDEAGLIEVVCDEEVIYCGKTIFAVVDYGQGRSFVQDSYGTYEGTTILALAKDCPNIKRGSLFTHKGKRLAVDAILQQTNIHVYVAVVCE